MAALGGVILGLFVLLIFQFPLKFTYYLIAGPVILFIATVSGRFKRFFQGMMIFIIPINFATHFFRRPYEFGSGGLDFSPLDIILIVLYAIWMYELLIKRNTRLHFFPKITIPVLSLVAISALSMIKAQDPYLTLFETIRILKVFSLFFYVANNIRSKKDISIVLVLLLGGLLMQSLIAFSQKWLGMSLGLELFGEYEELGSFTFDYYLMVARVGGTLGHANNLARYVGLLIPLSVTLLFAEIKLRYKLASALVFICAFITMLLTLSRGGWVCFAGSIVLAFMLIFRAKLIRMRTLVAISVVVVIFASITMGFSGLITSRLFGDDYGSAEGRIPLNKVAFSIIRAHPFLGVGVKNAWKVMHLYNPNLEPIPAERVHNAYLLSAAETGIPGLFIFLWVLISIFMQGLRNLKKKDVFHNCVNIGILAGMASSWILWLLYPVYIGGVTVFWVLVGLLLASSKMLEQGRLLPVEGRINRR